MLASDLHYRFSHEFYRHSNAAEYPFFEIRDFGVSRFYVNFSSPSGYIINDGPIITLSKIDALRFSYELKLPLDYQIDTTEVGFELNYIFGSEFSEKILSDNWTNLLY